MTDVFFVAGRLAEPPFSLQLTTAQLLNEIDPRELFQLLSKVLAHINGNGSSSGNRVENSIQSTETFLHWLRIFKYRPNGEE
jgi:hypothetical protein